MSIINKARLNKARHRLSFYLYHGIAAKLPYRLWQNQCADLIANLANYSDSEQQQILTRVGHMIRLSSPFTLHEPTQTLRHFHRKGHNSSYYLDLVNALKYFPQDNPFAYLFGDVTDVPEQPCFVKSRPIVANNHNSVLLKLDSVRHFYIPPERMAYADKKPLLVWRGAAHQPHRQAFLARFYNHPWCDVGCVHNKSLNTPYHREYLSIDEQRQYRFILSLEGNDVATNLKWIMASDSLCFMPRPRYETWFGEGLLKPGKHYVLLRDDYADLEEKLRYYRDNSAAACKIIANANQYLRQFTDYKKERLITLLVIQRYFALSQNNQ